MIGVKDTNKYATGIHDNMLKNKITNELSLRLSKYIVGPKTPAEKLNETEVKIGLQRDRFKKRTIER